MQSSSEWLFDVVHQYFKQNWIEHSVQENAVFFSNKTVPDISFEQYIRRCIKFFQCSPVCHLVGLVYLNRIIISYDKKSILMHSHNVYLLYSIALLLAVKMYDDTIFTNVYYARVMGYPIDVVNKTEVVFLQKINFNLVVHKEHYSNIL